MKHYSWWDGDRGPLRFEPAPGMPGFRQLQSTSGEVPAFDAQRLEAKACDLGSRRCECGRMTHEKAGETCNRRFVHFVPWYPSPDLLQQLGRACADRERELLADCLDSETPVKCPVLLWFMREPHVRVDLPPTPR